MAMGFIMTTVHDFTCKKHSVFRFCNHSCDSYTLSHELRIEESAAIFNQQNKSRNLGYGEFESVRIFNYAN